MKDAVLAQFDLAQILQVAHTICVGEETRLSIIATLHDVLRNIC